MSTLLGFGLLFSMLTSSAYSTQICGMDECPPGYNNLFCRPFDSVKKNWKDNPDIGAKLYYYMCVVETGAPILVKNDLVLLVYVDGIRDGRTVTVSVNDCAVTINDADTKKFRTGGLQFDAFKGTDKKVAQWYIVEPQMDNKLASDFESPFGAAVSVKCDFELSGDATTNRAPLHDPASDLTGVIEYRN
ncbi:hypothetical protein X739_32965 [Mesorhizobium sp. LNHC220B00]|nr:hypothetical protein X739_32965 [Mesorhizobium sp. LNHC220B00]